LEDTEFACAAIQIDRFVDTVMYDNSRSEALPLVEARDGVTYFELFLQADSPEVLAQISQNLDDDMGRVVRHVKSCGTGEDCFPAQTFVRYDLDMGRVGELLNCFDKSETNLQCAQHLTGLNSSIYYTVDSGVRETAYTLDDAFNFMTGTDSDGPLWPLDFIVQAVPIRVDGYPINIGEDWEPWEFPSIAEGVRALVANEINTNSGARLVFDDISEFVVLQRLFRSALEGHLGLDFPLHTLIDLQRSTAGQIVIERQEYWNHSDELFSFMGAQGGEIGTALQQELLRPHVSGECREALERARDAAKVSDWPNSPGVWPELAVIQESCFPSVSDDLRSRLSELNSLDLIDEANHIHAMRNR